MTLIRVVLVSPEDLAQVRRRLAAEIRRLADRFESLEVDVRDWHGTLSGFHEDGVQPRIDQHLQSDKADYLLGFFWTRFGKPEAPGGYSWTEFEIRRALQWRRTRKKPDVGVYFGNMPAEYSTEDEINQRLEVIKFKQEIRNKERGLAHEFATADALVEMVSFQLANSIKDRLRVEVDSNTDSGFRVAMSASTASVEAAGIAEEVGTITLTVPKRNAVPTPPGGCTFLVNVLIALNVNITNRPDCASLELRTALGLKVSARVMSNTKIIFESVPAPRPGSEGRAWVTISGIRANAAQLGASPDSFGEIFAWVQVQPDTVSFQVESPVARLAIASVGYAATAFKLISADSASQTGRWQRAYRVQFEARRSGSFSRPRAGHWATRFIVRLFEIPQGTSLVARVFDRRHPESPRAALVIGALADGDSGSCVRWSSVEESGATASIEVFEGGFAFAVWEFTPSDGQPTREPDTVWFDIGFSGDGAEPAELQNVIIACDLAPLSTVFTADSSEPIPRFTEHGEEFALSGIGIGITEDSH